METPAHKVKKTHSLASVFRDRLGTMLIVAAVTLIGLFPNVLLDRVKFALTKTELREDRYIKVADQLSAYLSAADFVQQELDKNLTTKKDLEVIIEGQDGYNSAIVSLQKQQYSDRAIIARYWNKQTAKKFEELMQTVNAIDSLAHSLNEEFEKVTSGSEKKVSREAAKKVADAMKPLVDELRTQISDLLSQP